MIRPATRNETGSLSLLAESSQQEAGDLNAHLQSCIHDALEPHALQLRQVKVIANRGCVRLTGRVGSYYLKQVAQERTLATEGVRILENELVVVP